MALTAHREKRFIQINGRPRFSLSSGVPDESGWWKIMSEEDIPDLYHRVLTHYLSKAEKLVNDDEIDHSGKGLIQSEVQRLRGEIADFEQRVETSRDVEFKETLRDYKDLLLEAFPMYITDLEGSRGIFLKTFKSVELRGLNQEIEFAKKGLDDIRVSVKGQTP
jgi:hypothetical protein